MRAMGLSYPASVVGLGRVRVPCGLVETRMYRIDGCGYCGGDFGGRMFANGEEK